MGSNSLRIMSALVAFSAFLVGCTNGPQKDKGFGAYNNNSQNGKSQQAQGTGTGSQSPFPIRQENNANFVNQQKSGVPELPKFQQTGSLNNGGPSLQTGNSPQFPNTQSGVNGQANNPFFKNQPAPVVPQQPQPPFNPNSGLQTGSSTFGEQRSNIQIPQAPSTAAPGTLGPIDIK